MHGCTINTVATAALVLKHQAISIHSTEYVCIYCIGLVSHKNVAFTAFKSEIEIAILKKKNSQWLIIFGKKKKSYVDYNDVIMGTMASQIIILTAVYSIIYSGAHQRKH